MIAKYEKEHGTSDEKNPPSKSQRPDKKKMKDGTPDNVSKTGGDGKKVGKTSQIEEERPESHYEVLKRTSIDSEIVFKVFDQTTKKEQFMSRKDLLREDPVALCLFYEKHIVS